MYILYSFVARALWLCLHPCPRPCDDACTAPHHEVPAGSISRTTYFTYATMLEMSREIMNALAEPQNLVVHAETDR